MELRDEFAIKSLGIAASMTPYEMSKPAYFEGYDHRMWDPNSAADMAEMDAVNKEQEDFHAQSAEFAASYPARLAQNAYLLADALLAARSTSQEQTCGQ